MFLLFTDGNLGDDSEEEGTVMLNLDSVADEKPVRWVPQPGIEYLYLCTCLLLRPTDISG